MTGYSSDQNSECPVFEIYHQRLLGIEPILGKFKKLTPLFTWLEEFLLSELVHFVSVLPFDYNPSNFLFI